MYLRVRLIFMSKILRKITILLLLFGENSWAKSALDYRNAADLETAGGTGFGISYAADIFKAERGSDGALKLTKRSLNPRENLSEVLIFIESARVPVGKKCKASLFKSLINGYSVDSIKTVTENDFTYSVSLASGKISNRQKYEEIWTVVDSNPCVAVRYFYETSNSGIFDERPKKDFNRDALESLFFDIRHAVTFSRITKNPNEDPNESSLQPGSFFAKTYRYKNGKNGFVVSYPEGFFAENNGALDPNYFDGFGKNNGVVIHKGDKNSVAGSLVNPTFAVEMLPISSYEKCRAKLFVNNDRMTLKEKEIEDDGVIYSVIDSFDYYGDGNEYGREVILAMPYSNPCVAVRYFYATIKDSENFERERSDILGLFKKIRSSLILN
jgi:hypothetical protein